MDRAALEALPQGDQTPLEKILLQTPGVSRDSAASGNLHIRNEHANVQYRVNGILLPDGVSGFSAAYRDQLRRLRCRSSPGRCRRDLGCGPPPLVDIVSRAPPPTPGGSVSVYGGSHGTGQTAFDHGAKFGPWEVFAAGRLSMNSLGIENPTDSHEAVHDRTRQGKFFGFLFYAIDDATKLSFITGTSVANYQIPNNPGQPRTAFGMGTVRVRQAQREPSRAKLLQRRRLDPRGRRYRHATVVLLALLEVHFVPDGIGDLIFNGVSSDIRRSSFVTGLQGDGAYRIGGGHTFARRLHGAARRRKP